MADQPDSALHRAFASPFVTEVPPAAVMRLLSRYERGQLAAFLEVAIDLLDLAEPDPDLEDSDEDGQCTEDELSCGPGNWGSLMCDWQSGGPGCEISDPGGGNVEDEGEAIDEREPEECIHAAYGIDQSRGPLPPHLSDTEAAQ